MASKHVVVHGTVQGVSFRAYAVQRAEELGVTGWVRNRDDGAVEMHVEGDDDAVGRMLSWTQEGPRHAEVTSVDTTDADPEGHREFSQA